MKATKEQIKTACQQAIKDTGLKPASGMVCALASLRILRDVYNIDKEAISLVIKDLAASGGPEHGFLSNASAMAKAAGFEGEKPASLAALTD